MAHLNLQEVREWDRNILLKKIDELRVSSFKLKMSAVSGEIKMPHRIKKLKRDIAKLLTIKNEKGRN